MSADQTNVWKGAISAGLIAGGVSLLLALVGMVAAFSESDIISGVFSMGELLLLAPLVAGGYLALNRVEDKSVGKGLLVGLLAGFFGGLVLTILLVVGQQVDLRQMFPNASPDLYSLIAFGVAPPLGYFVPLIYGSIIGAIGAGLVLLPSRVRSSVLSASAWVIILGLFRDMFFLIPTLTRPGPFTTIFRWIFAPSGLSVPAAIILFIAIGGISYWRSGQTRAHPQTQFLRAETLCSLDGNRHLHRHFAYSTSGFWDILYRGSGQCWDLHHHGPRPEHRGGICWSA